MRGPQTYLVPVASGGTASLLLTVGGRDTGAALESPATRRASRASIVQKTARGIHEEASGMIAASEVIAPDWFLLDVQAHYATGSELVEGGQLLAIYDPAALRGAVVNREAAFVAVSRFACPSNLR